MNWPIRSLGEIVSVGRRQIHPLDIPPGTPYVGLEHIEKDGRGLREVSTVGESGVSSAKFEFDEKAILFGKLRPNLGKIARPHVPGVCSTDLIPLWPEPCVDRDYLFHLLAQPSSIKVAGGLSTGANLPRLSVANLLKMRVAVPDISEQRSIAQRLDWAVAAREARLRSMDLIPKIVLAAFDHVASDERSWPRVPLGQLIADAKLGLIRSAAQQGEGRAHEYIKMDAITRAGEMRFESFVKVDASAQELQNSTVRGGDLLFNTRNTRELVGKSAVYEGPPRLFNNNLMRLRFTGDVLSTFVHGFLWSRDGQKQLDRRKAGTTSEPLSVAVLQLAQDEGGGDDRGDAPRAEADVA